MSDTVTSSAPQCDRCVRPTWNAGRVCAKCLDEEDLRRGQGVPKHRLKKVRKVKKA